MSNCGNGCSCNDSAIDNVFLPREAEILRAEQVTASEKHFTLKMKDGKGMDFQPGQIAEVGVFGYGEIPLGFASSPTRTHSFDLVVRTVGRVSTAINKLEKGQSLWVRGPLGSGFNLEEMRGHDVLIVAGGIGLCPTRSLIQYILDRRSEFGKFTLFFGARTPKDQLFTDDLVQWRKTKDVVEYHETVDKGDDSWKGNVGVITTLFAKTKISPDTRVVVCGPPVMYKFVIRELAKLGVPENHVYLDLERRMKCGIGKCGHCQINDKYVCVDGPVFTYSDIKHLEEAFA
ncbi:MAG: FAD/NAD(P)-binding protein [Oligoflexia bacterium]|nr:FAD/NAD(P)-binding protein [Oligoflexia bacterium]